MKRSGKQNLLIGLAFLAPNIAGFLAFTLVPLVVSLIMAFTNWDLRLHNMFKPGVAPRFVGLDNFYRLFAEPQLGQYLGNTLFFMAGTPFCIAGSLALAMMLNRDRSPRSRRALAMLIAGAGLVSACVMLALVGLGATGMVLLVTGLAFAILLGGMAGGSTVYRTLFYIPNFTAGIAIFLLWKKLYNPTSGPVNAAIRPVVTLIQAIVLAIPTSAFTLLAYALFALAMLALIWGLRQLQHACRSAEMGHLSIVLSTIIMALPLLVAWRIHWLIIPPYAAFGVLLIAVVYFIVTTYGHEPCRADEGLGTALLLACTVLTLEFALIGLAAVCNELPHVARQGLAPPEWLTSYYWAKPAIMLMGFWAALGSNTMLLYLAGLSNIPAELYEAASIDGAGRFQNFWHVTWPQLAPTTFFVVIMSVIGGLQGGFDTAKAMTNGGPAGATTTLSFFIYTEGFQTGRLGYSSAIAWVLFLLVLAVTAFNWKFGRRYVND